MTDAAQKQQFLACLSDPSRFSLVTMLASGPRCVTDLATLVGLSQSCTTRHLQALLREGIVSGERHGKRVVYALLVSDPDARSVLRWACGSIEAPAATAATADSTEAREAGRSVRRTREGASSRRSRSAEAVAVDAVEVTDSMIVANDSPWQAADEPGDLHESPEFSTASHPRSPRPVRTDLDDFLL